MQRPWLCPDQDPDVSVDKAWQAEGARCAWQNRLRVRAWHASEGNATGACISGQAAWWGRAMRDATKPAVVPFAWQRYWTSQSAIFDSAQEKRILLLRRGRDGQWRATEWRWNPSERAATRAWEQARWDMLAAEAARLHQSAPVVTAARTGDLLWGLMVTRTGGRPSEVNGDTLRWQVGGHCLQVDSASPGPQQLQLSYAVDDSRLEQRAAMQLQLARRFPHASWLTPFSLLPAPATGRGGAKFYAIWLDAGVVAGQIWIPVRGDGPLQRLRITTGVAGSSAQPDPDRVAQAKQLIERELLDLAAQWSGSHDER